MTTIGSQNSAHAKLKVGKVHLLLFPIGLFVLIMTLVQSLMHSNAATNPPPSVTTHLVGAAELAPVSTDIRTNSGFAHQPKPPDKVLPFVKKTSGQNWAVWDGETILFAHDDASSFDFGPCRWARYNVSSGDNELLETTRINKPDVSSVPICLHPTSDIVSDHIAVNGRWIDCPYLGEELWRNVFLHEVNKGTKKFVHVEVGANIGACVLDVLLVTPPNVHVVAFEPNPQNLFRLTSTLKTLFTLHPEFRHRIQLFPIGLGQEAKSDFIYGATGNLGHSTIGKGVAEFYNQQFDSALPIHIERFDDVIDSTSDDFEFAVMKMDAQGFECNIVEGMPSLLLQKSRLQLVSFEFDNHLLSSFGCPYGQRIWDRLHSSSFKIMSRALKRLVENPLPAIVEAEIESGPLEMVAVRADYEISLRQQRQEQDVLVMTPE